MSSLSMPEEPGFYLARVRYVEWFNALIRVYGDKPFFHMDAILLYDHSTLKDFPLHEVNEFGPRVHIEDLSSLAMKEKKELEKRR